MRPLIANESRSGAVKRSSRGGHRFEFDVAWPPYLDRQHRDLMAFIADMDGGLTSFELVVPSTEALGTAAGSPVVRDAHVQGARSIKTRGWYPRSRVLLSGDLIRIKQKVYRVTQRARTNNSGEVTINISPGLMQAASDSEGIVTRGISFRVFIAQNSIESPMIQTGAGIAYRTSLTLREDWI